MYTNPNNLYKRLLIVGVVTCCCLGFMRCMAGDTIGTSESARNTLIVPKASFTPPANEAKVDSFDITTLPPATFTVEITNTVVASETIEPTIASIDPPFLQYFMAIDDISNWTDYDKRIQVWQISPDNWLFSKHYELTRTMNSPVQVQVPSGTTATRIFELVPTTTPPKEIFNDYTLNESTLAKTGTVWADIESVMRCVERSPICFGLYRLYTFNFETGEEKVLLDIPSHFEGSDGYDGRRGIGSLHISPDGQYLAMIEAIFEAGFYTTKPIIMNIEQETPIDIPDMTDVSEVIGWSADSSTVVLKLSPREKSRGFRLCSVVSKECQDIELENLWIDSLIDWHPSEPQFVFSATESNVTLETCYDLKLYTVKMRTNTSEVQQIPVELNLSQPRWSPDGTYIAAHKRKENNSVNCVSGYPSLYTNIIVVIEAASGELIQEITGDDTQFIRDGSRPPQWNWGDNHTLLIQGARGMKVVDIDNGVSRMVPYPPEMWDTKVWFRQSLSEFN